MMTPILHVVAWTTQLLLLLPTPSAYSLLKHDDSPLFTKAFQVHSLFGQSYEDMLKDNNTVWLVDYYAPWCPHCRHFAPEWEQVANFYANTGKVQVGAVDCMENRVICNREGIRGYPSVKLYHVPADAEKALMMPRHYGTNGKAVIEWSEKLMKEHGVESGMDVEDIASHLEKFKNGIIAGDKDNKKLTYSDHSLAMKFKRLHDAGIAAMSTIQNDFFIGSDVLEGERYEVALMWVEALTATFPIKKNQLVLASLANLIRLSNHWNYADWKKMLDKWKEEGRDKTIPTNLFMSGDDKPWLFCKTYTCGLWTLFHTITVSDVAANSTESRTHSWKPSEVMAAIRLFVQNFFGCAECREHFMSSNPESIINALAMSDREGPHAVIMWMWKLHNTVNKAIKKEQWPSKIVCPICYVEDGHSVSLNSVRLHEKEIVAYVTSAYGHDEEEIYKMDPAYNGTLVALWSSVDTFNAVMMVLGLFVLLTVAYKTRGQRSLDRKVLMSRDHMA